MNGFYRKEVNRRTIYTYRTTLDSAGQRLGVPNGTEIRIVFENGKFSDVIIPDTVSRSTRNRAYWHFCEAIAHLVEELELSATEKGAIP